MKGTITCNAETYFSLTLPISGSTFVSPVMNMDVASGGWYYMNGVCLLSNTNKSIVYGRCYVCTSSSAVAYSCIAITDY